MMNDPSSKKTGSRIIIYFIVAVLAIIPALLIIRTQIYYSHINETDAETVRAHYQGYVSIRFRPGYVLSFSDHDTMCIVWDIDSFENNAESIKPGTELVMQVHPKNHNIMSIYTDDRTVCDFKDSIHGLDRERTIFLIIGLGIYVLYALIIYCFKRKAKR